MWKGKLAKRSGCGAHFFVRSCNKGARVALFGLYNGPLTHMSHPPDIFLTCLSVFSCICFLIVRICVRRRNDATVQVTQCNGDQ